MRSTLHAQVPIVQPYIEHQHAHELQAISEILECIPGLLDGVLADLLHGSIHPGNGREGMTAEQVLRALILKQMNGFSYEELAFHLADSCCYRAFCRIGLGSKSPSKATLQRNIKRLAPETLEEINRALISHARREGIERGRKVRVDCTVMESNIHEPSDSSLLWDSVRVLVRLMLRGRQWVATPMTDHRRRAKRRAIGIRNAKRKKQRIGRYRDLLKVTQKTIGAAKQMVTDLEQFQDADLMAVVMAREVALDLKYYLLFAEHVARQTRRRVIDEKKVPASEKIVSIFEPHTDLIIKDRRDTYFGHKLTLSSGASGLILDCVVEDGNPADSTLALRMVERQAELYGRVPRQVAFDGGFASRGNLKDIKHLGVQDVAFSKRPGLKVNEMVKSSWVYRRLRNFRAGIEGIISFLKRGFGMSRCTWRSHDSFKAYAWASILSANLLLMARHQLA
ncbi:MAG: ISNCY family transposase [Candidatus Eisenbacteria sp.]|nr:ISNCY family transposase [Candidatus Eisenbacteria bacterium]